MKTVLVLTTLPYKYCRPKSLVTLYYTYKRVLVQSQNANHPFVPKLPPTSIQTE